jgi:hypothetical protein
MDFVTELVSSVQSLWLAGAFLFLGLQLLLRPAVCAEKFTSLADRFQSRGMPIPMRGSAPAAVPDTPWVRGVLRTAGVALILSSLLYLPGVF